MLFQLAWWPCISNDSMRGRVRSNYFSVRAGIAQKATFARDVEPTWQRNAGTHARTIRVVRTQAHEFPVESIKKNGEKMHAVATFGGSRATMASCFIPAGRPAVCLDYACTNESSCDSIVPVFQFCVGIVVRHDIFIGRTFIILADCFSSSPFPHPFEMRRFYSSIVDFRRDPLKCPIDLYFCRTIVTPMDEVVLYYPRYIPLKNKRHARAVRYNSRSFVRISYILIDCLSRGICTVNQGIKGGC